MRYALVLSFVLLVLAPIIGAANDPGSVPNPQTDRWCAQLGSGEGMRMDVETDFPRDEWEYWENWDGTAENGYCWYGDGLQDPFYGAFAEGFHGPGHVMGTRIYLTHAAYWAGQSGDLFVWGDGIGEPGCVLQMIPGVVPEHVPEWPEYAPNDFELDVEVGHDFYIGLQADYWWHCAWYVCADENGPVGNPWTCVWPGHDPPTGWQPVWIVFPEGKSMGIGVFIEGTASVPEFPEGGPTPESPTWGRIKAIFGK